MMNSFFVSRLSIQAVMASMVVSQFPSKCNFIKVANNLRVFLNVRDANNRYD